MGGFINRLLTPFNVIAALLLAAVGLIRVGQDRPISFGLDPEIVAFVQGPKKASSTLKLYFAGLDARSFAIESRTVGLDGTNLGFLANAAVKEWVSGPQAQGAIGLVPSDFAQPEVFAERAGIVVNLPKSWRRAQWGRSGEWLLLCGLANTLLELPKVNSVRYLLEGNAVETVYGHVGMLEPFTEKSCK
jgi:hypothetical protein